MSVVPRETFRGVFGPSRIPFDLLNRTGYDTHDLSRFCARGLTALGAKRPKRIAFLAAPQRSRGCAEVGGSRLPSGEERDVVIAISPPHKFSLRRLARLFQHEITHSRGFEHKAMSHEVLWSLGPVPEWAKGLRIRYRGRAPRQLP